MGKPKRNVKSGPSRAVPQTKGQLKISNFFSKTLISGSAGQANDTFLDSVRAKPGPISSTLGGVPKRSPTSRLKVDKPDQVIPNSIDSDNDDCVIVCNVEPTVNISYISTASKSSFDHSQGHHEDDIQNRPVDELQVLENDSDADFIELTPTKSPRHKPRPSRKRKLGKHARPSLHSVKCSKVLDNRPTEKPSRMNTSPSIMPLPKKLTQERISCRSKPISQQSQSLHQNETKTRLHNSIQQISIETLAKISESSACPKFDKLLRPKPLMTNGITHTKELGLGLARVSNMASSGTDACTSALNLPQPSSVHISVEDNVDTLHTGLYIQSSRPVRDGRTPHAIENTTITLGLPSMENAEIALTSTSDHARPQSIIDEVESVEISKLLLVKQEECGDMTKVPTLSLVSKNSPHKNVCQQSTAKSDNNMEGLLDGLVLEDWDLNSQPTAPSNTLCLDKLHRCKVLGVDEVPGKRDKILKLQSTVDGSTTTCLLQGFWCGYDISPDSVVCVVASPASTHGSFGPWVVDSTGGLVVLNPDLLISGTAVVGSLFCKRRSVLSTHYQGMDSESRVMVVGILVHNLLQTVLKQNLSRAPEIKKLAEDLITTPDSIRMLYSSGLSLLETLKEISSFVPQIVNFIGRYVKDEMGPPESHSSSKSNWKGKITGVLDIEENVWAPRLGLKGKIDITAEVRPHGRHNRRGIAPVELKTGRASWDAQHKGQVILYKMMMAETGTPADTGLLLYLRSGEIGTVEESHAERAGLINLRNELSTYLAPNKHSKAGTMVLPEPINHHAACGKCPYLTLCSAYLQHDGLESVADNNPLKELIGPATSHLAPQHINYFMHFSRLLLLEDNASDTGNSTSELWTLTPQQRADRGTCLHDLSIAAKSENASGRCEYTFQQVSSSSLDLRASTLSPGDYVALSTDSRVAVHTGTIIDITPSTVSIILDRAVAKDFEKSSFHVDSLSGSRNSALNMTFLSLLMEDSEKAEKLRRTVIDKVPPTFAEVLPSTVAKEAAITLTQLNGDQKLAVLKVLYANDYLLIKGMPGTGKTSTIATLVTLLVKLGQSVLVVAHTHSAVDNMLLKIKERGVDPLRLGSASRIHPELREHGEAELYRNSATPEELEERYMSKPVVGCTCLGMGHTLLVRRRFNACIVDESTQVLQCTVLRSIFIADKFVLVGDPDQLAPLVRSREAAASGLSESLFARLDKPESTIVLKEQYRMNQTLTDLANGLTYGGRLKCGSPEVANATINLQSYPESPSVSSTLSPHASWLKLALSKRLEHSVIFLDTGKTIDWREKSMPRENQENQHKNKEELKCKNICEAAIITQLLVKLKMGGVCGSAVGVMAPYRAQVASLKQVAELLEGTEVNTVDQFQGRDKEVILYSCTRSDANDAVTDAAPRISDIMNDKRRLTVAITRAKHKLVIVGDAATLRNYEPFRQLLDCLGEWQIIPLRDGVDGFYWAPLISETQALIKTKS